MKVACVHTVRGFEHDRLGHVGHKVARLGEADDAILMLEPRDAPVEVSQLDLALAPQNSCSLDRLAKR
jgi:hypothetical protein